MATEQIRAIACQLRNLASELEQMPDAVELPGNIERAVRKLARISLPESVPAPVSMARIAEIVAREQHIELREMRSKNRRAKVVFARQVACFLIREMRQDSYPAIGDYFRRDHSTVINGVQLVAERVAEHPGFAQQLRALRQLIVNIEEEGLDGNAA
jgi:chromosomal replication initiation ATPase DnaA